MWVYHGPFLASECAPRPDLLLSLLCSTLSHNLLSGPIPSTIGTLFYLRTLELDDNFLNGVVPATLQQLSNLTLFNVSHNSVAGFLTSWLGNWPQLEVFSAFSTSLWSYAAQYATTPEIALCTGLRVLELGGPNVGLPFPPTMGLLSNLEVFDFRYATIGEWPNVTHLSNLTTLMGSFGTLPYVQFPSDFGDSLPLLQTLIITSGVNGSLPSSIGNLTELRNLSLSGLRLEGYLPHSIGMLTKLEYLDVSGSVNLTGPIPDTFGNLSSLRVFRADRCSLTALPDSIGSLSQLQTLSLQDNRIVSVPATLGNLPQLRFLSLQNNSISGPIPTSIGLLSNLEMLSLGSNMFSSLIDFSNLTNLWFFAADSMTLGGPFPTSVSVFKNITSLSMRNNGFTGTIPDDFFLALPKLRSVGLSNNRLSGPLPSSLANLTNLHVLDVSSNEFEEPIPDISHLPIQSFLANYNRFGGSVPPWLGNMSNLMSPIGLAYNNFNGTLPDELGLATNPLLMVDLSHNDLVGGLPATFTSSSAIRSLDVTFNRMRFCPSLVTSLNPIFSCNLQNQNVTDYDCGCAPSVFAQCASSPAILQQCIPCQSGAPSDDISWQCRDGYWFYNSFLIYPPSPYISSTSVTTSYFAFQGAATGNGTAFSDHLEMALSSAALIGNLTTNSITFNGIQAQLNVSRCIEVQSISIILSNADIELLKATGGVLPRPLLNYGSEFLFDASVCNPMRAPISLTQTGNSCTKVSLSSSQSISLSSQFTLDSTSCKKKSAPWWAILLGTILGIAIVVGTIVLLAIFVKPIKHFFRPYQKRSDARLQPI